MSQQVNLYSPIFRRQEKKFSARAMLQAGAAILLGIAVIAGLNFWQLAALRADLHAVNKQHDAALKQLQDAGRDFKPRVGDLRLEEEVNKLEALLSVSSQSQQLLRRDVFGDSRGYSTYFIAFARQSVPDLWLTGVDIVGAGESIEISGRTTVPERVPQYLQRLSSEKVLSGAEFKVFRLERPDEEVAVAGGAVPRKPKPAAHVEFTIRTAPAAAAGAAAVAGAPR